MSDLPADVRELKFRDPRRAGGLAAALERLAAELPAPITLMHVCGSHEQAIARYGLRSVLPAEIRVSMGPGCPVCVTDMPEVDEAVALARQGVHVATYGDMLRVPGSRMSLMDARAEGGHVHVVYGIEQAVALARGTDAEVVFFATGFETTAVTTASALLRTPPPNFSVLSAHKYILPAMEIVVQVPGTAIAGFLAAGHAATITGCAIFEPFAAAHRRPGRGRRLRAARHPRGAGTARRAGARRRAPRSEHVPALCHPRRQPARAGAALARVRAHVGPLARHRRDPRRQHATQARVGPLRRAPPVRHRPGRLQGWPAALAGGAVRVRRDHDRPQVAGGLPALRRGLHARDAGRRVHGQQRGGVPHLARIRRGTRRIQGTQRTQRKKTKNTKGTKEHEGHEGHELHTGARP